MAVTWPAYSESDNRAPDSQNHYGEDFTCHSRLSPLLLAFFVPLASHFKDKERGDNCNLFMAILEATAWPGNSSGFRGAFWRPVA